MGQLVDQPLIALALLVALWLLAKMTIDVTKDEQTSRMDIIFSICMFVFDIVILLNITFLSNSWLVQMINTVSIIIIVIIIFTLAKDKRLKKEKV